MSLIHALYSGLTGINANGTNLGIIGDNLANVNTVGFKSSRAVFGDLLAHIAPCNYSQAQMGAGTHLMDIEQNFNQGSMKATTSALDLAIQGRGFFVVSGQYNGVDSLFYTRAGNFKLDSEGYLVTTAGLRVQGYPANTAGSLLNTIGDLRLSGLNLAPKSTGNLELFGAFDPHETVQVFDPANPGSTATFLSEISVYDSLGQGHRLQVYVNRTGANAWEWHIMAQSDELAAPGPNPLEEVFQGTLTFDAEGRLDTEAQVAGGVDFLNATPGQVITVDFGDSITTDGGTGSLGSTQTSEGVSYINSNAQDGFPTGILSTIKVDSSGSLVGGFSNGMTRLLGRIALGSFPSDRGLARAGDSLWKETQYSGEAAVGQANQHGRGSILNNTLEQSNVDMSNEFVGMILSQRAFQASSRSITTSDQLMNEVINMKR